MPKQEKLEKFSAALDLSRFFQVEFTLKMFGKVLIHWVYPPKSNENDS